MKKTGPSNENLQSLIVDLKKQAIKEDVPLFKRLASELERPTRSRRIVNLSRINMNTEKDDFVVIPGKVLGSGDLDHPVTIAAYKVSTSAISKISSSKSKIVSINDLIKTGIKGKKIRLMC
jgi:large subunit ribosomal protein L18e